MTRTFTKTMICVVGVAAVVGGAYLATPYFKSQSAGATTTGQGITRDAVAEGNLPAGTLPEEASKTAISGGQKTVDWPNALTHSPVVKASVMPISAGAPVSKHPLTRNGNYQLTNVATGLTLGFHQTPNAGETLTQAMLRGNADQSIALKAQQDGSVQLNSVVSGLCVMPGPVDSLITGACGQANQKFVAKDSALGLVLTQVSTGKAISVSRTANASAAPSVQLAAPTGGPEQEFKVTPGNFARIETRGRAMVGAGPPIAAQTTLRQSARMTASGSNPRIMFSNKYGTAPLAIASTTIAHQAEESTPTGLPSLVTFAGQPAVTIPVGQEIYSDPVGNFDVTAGKTVLVSTFVTSEVPVSTGHNMANSNTYFADQVDATRAQTEDAFSRLDTKTYFIKAIDVMSNSTLKSLVTLGDSITDGGNSTFNANQGWTDLLADRLRQTGAPAASISNVGIAGNHVVVPSTGIVGDAAVNRFDTDVVQRRGATGVFIFEGVNDTFSMLNSSDIIAGLQDVVTQARNADLAVNIATISPSHECGSPTDDREVARQEVNAWIRANSVKADYVVDFDAALRNPADPICLRPELDSGDHLHPNSTGMQVLADSLDLTKLSY